jgi:protein involved in polysaccharide export with SLBB domain
MRVSPLVLALALTGCAHLQRDVEYRLHPGDTLKVVIFGELEEQVVVRPDQRISLPIIGEVSTRRKTPAQLSDELSVKYALTAVVIVQECRTWQASLKDALALARDVLLVSLAASRLADD